MLIQEWKNLFKNKILVLSLFVLALIPIIYAGILLSSYWDPFGKTSNLKVAVVNEDIPKTFEGKELNIGEELVNNLKDNDDFDWHFVNSKEATKGYEKGEYYMIITIPKNFSKNASSVLNDDVKKMNLEYKLNPGRNYFAETLGKQAMDNINREISESVTKEYAKAVFSTIEEIGDGFEDASEGSKKINDGTEELKSGSSQLTENLKKLSSSTLSFQNGAEKIQVGVSELIKGMSSLESGSSKLNTAIIQYTDGISTLQEKTAPLSDPENGIPKLASSQNSLNDGIKTVHNGNQSIEKGLVQLNSSLPSNEQVNTLDTNLSELQKTIATIEQTILDDPNSSEELKTQISTLKISTEALQPKIHDSLMGINTVRDSLSNTIIPKTNQLNTKFSNLVTASNQISKSTNDLSKQMPTLIGVINQLNSKGADLKNGSEVLHIGTQKISDNLSELSNGINQLASASGSINNATSSLADGSSKISDGLVSLNEGTSELSTKLSDASDDVNSLEMNDSNFEMFSSPVEIIAQKDNEVPNYGHALAPNFISLALFIGAIAFNLIYPIATASIKPTSAFSWWFSKFSVILIQSTAAALILDFILLSIIDLEVGNKPLFITVSLLVSLASMSIVSFLVVAFDNPGRFIATIFMVLQLASSGGMFPTELQSPFFQSINPFMLMTYSVFSFRETMTGAVGHVVFSNSLTILISTIVLSNLFMLISMFVKMKRKKYTELESQ